MRSVLTIGLAAGLSVGGAMSASAALIDFTDPSVFTTMNANEAVGGSGNTYFRITSSPFGQLSYNTGDDAPAPGPALVPGSPLAGDGDGIGIRDDESGPNEYLVLEFFSDAALTISKTVSLQGAHFLDLFKADEDDDNPESVFIYDGAPPAAANLLEGPIDGDAVCCQFGYKFASFSHSGSIFSFDSGDGNDERGVRDFALAAVEVGPIPLPAGVLLLGTAIAGLGFARRRKS